MFFISKEKLEAAHSGRFSVSLGEHCFLLSLLAKNSERTIFSREKNASFGGLYFKVIYILLNAVSLVQDLDERESLEVSGEEDDEEIEIDDKPEKKGDKESEPKDGEVRCLKIGLFGIRKVF